MKTFPFDISYYALFWTAYNQVQENMKEYSRQKEPQAGRLFVDTDQSANDQFSIS